MPYLKDKLRSYLGIDAYVGTYDQFKKLGTDFKGIRNPYKDSYADQLATVYTCGKIYYDSIGLPINVIQKQSDGAKLVDNSDYRQTLLHYQPNAYTSPNKFFGTLEYLRQIHGNSFARIWRDGAGKATKFTIASGKNPKSLYCSTNWIIDSSLLLIF